MSFYNALGLLLHGLLLQDSEEDWSEGFMWLMWSRICSSCTHCPPLQFTIVMIPLGHSLSVATCLQLGRVLSTRSGRRRFEQCHQHLQQVCRGASRTVLFSYHPSHPPNQVHVECLSLCLLPLPLSSSLSSSLNILFSLWRSGPPFQQ